MKYKVTATMDVGYETIIEANTEEEAEYLAWDRVELDFRLWEKASNGASLTWDGSNFEVEEEV